MAEEQEKQETKEVENSSNLKPIIILVLIVIIIELIAVGFIIFSVKGSDNTKKKEETVQKEVKEDSLNSQMAYSKPIEVLVNVKGTNGDRYFKAVLIIEYNATKYPMLAELIDLKLPVFKDIAINILSSKDINILENYKLRNNIRAELLEAFSKEIPKTKGKINNVLINEWLIQ